MERARPRLESPADLDALLRNVAALKAHIEEASLRGERARRLDPETLGHLTDAGLFRMTMPADWDGLDLSLAAQADVIERLAALDAAVAWAVVAGSGAGLALRNVPRDAALDLFPHPDMAQCSALIPEASGVRIGGMYRITGHWSGASGAQEADVAVLPFAVVEAGEPTGQTRVAVLPTGHLTAIPEGGRALAAVGWAEVRPVTGHLSVPEAHTYAGPTTDERLRVRVLAAAVAVGLAGRFAGGVHEARWQAARALLVDVARSAEDLHRAGLAAQFATEVACDAVHGAASDVAARRAALDALTLRQLLPDI